MFLTKKLLFVIQTSFKLYENLNIFRHRVETGHHFQFTETKIVDYKRTKYKRNIREMLHIGVNNTFSVLILKI